MDLSILNDALPDIVDSSMHDMDSLKMSLELTTHNTEVKVMNGNEEVYEILKGFQTTKLMRKQMYKKSAKLFWLAETKSRYSRYMDFVEDSQDTFPDICSNVEAINKLFKHGLLNIQDMVKVVYKTDKLLLKFLRKEKYIL
jgi:hypothetical protein